MLGGSAKKANIELHDVRWVVGSKIEDTYYILKNNGLDLQKVCILIAIKELKILMPLKLI